MSKERVLLKEFIDFVDSYEFYPTERNIIFEIVNRANAILAQPEQTEQEPVAWMLIDKETGARIPKAYKPEHGVNKDRWELYPLHTTLTKREPLSDEEIDKGYQESDGNYYDLAFRDGVRFAEKHHGIGGGE